MSRSMGIQEMASVKNRYGDEKRVVDWVKEAWLEIQALRSGAQEYSQWNFLWARKQFNLSADEDEYAVTSAPVSHWDMDGFSIFPVGDESSEVRLSAVLYSDHQSSDLGVPTTGKPSKVIILPNGNLIFKPTPDIAYSVQGAFWKRPIELTENTDVPACPEHHHRIIIDKALSYYYEYEQDTNGIRTAEARFAQKFRAMEKSELSSTFMTVIPE